jgi:glutathione S-transferase
MIKLYDLVGKDNLSFSPYCWRIKYLLNYKNIPYQIIPTTFTARIKNNFFGESRLPTILDNNEKISDSFIIAKYIEKKYFDHSSILISSSNIDSITFINNWADTFLNRSIVQRILNDISFHLDEDDRDYFITSRTNRFGEHPRDYQAKNLLIVNNEFLQNCKFLNIHLSDRTFLLGDKISYADLIIAGSFLWGEKVSTNTRIDNTFEHLLKWKEGIKNIFEK